MDIILINRIAVMYVIYADSIQ